MHISNLLGCCVQLKMSGLLIAVFCIFALVVYVSLGIFDRGIRQVVVGYLSIVSLVSMFASPFFNIVCSFVPYMSLLLPLSLYSSSYFIFYIVR